MSRRSWFKQLMEQYRKENYTIEIFFVFADEDVMERRAQARERETGRHTSRKHVRDTHALHNSPTDASHRSKNQLRKRLEAYKTLRNGSTYIAYV